MSKEDSPLVKFLKFMLYIQLRVVIKTSGFLIYYKGKCAISVYFILETRTCLTEE